MYVNTTQAASLLKISPSRLRQLLQKGRVRGAYKTGKYWLIRLYDGMPYVEETKRGQAGTWKVAKKPQKTTVNINSNIIRQNIKKSKAERKPAIAVKGKEKHYVYEKGRRGCYHPQLPFGTERERFPFTRLLI